MFSRFFSPASWFFCVSAPPRTPAGRRPRQFMQSYYVAADLTAAAGLSDGPALDKVNASRGLTQGYPIDGSTHHPEIAFDLVRGAADADEAEYLFRVTIRPDRFPRIEKQARLKLRRRDAGWMVTQFSEASGNGAP